jgi:hypothetical protein
MDHGLKALALLCVIALVSSYFESIPFMIHANLGILIANSALIAPFKIQHAYETTVDSAHGLAQFCFWFSILISAIGYQIPR